MIFTLSMYAAYVIELLATGDAANVRVYTVTLRESWQPEPVEAFTSVEPSRIQVTNPPDDMLTV